MQTEDYLRLFSDRSLNKDDRQLFEDTANRLAQLAYDCLIWVDTKWHLIACRYNFPMQLTLFNTLSDCMEQVSGRQPVHAWYMHACMHLCVFRKHTCMH